MAETVKNIALKDLHDFPENPFKVQDNEEMAAMAESIRDYGIISPLIVRPRDEGGGYEIISGHRRKYASQKAGIEKVPAFVRSMDRDAAVIALVDSNMHRENILPSEKAYAYKLKLEAMKRQGQRTDLGTSRQVVDKSKSADQLGQDADVSGRTIQRYIRLTELIPPVLQLVDDGLLSFTSAIDVSYLSPAEQENLYETMQSEERAPSMSQAQRIKQLSQAGRLDMDAIFTIMTEEKPNEKEKIKLHKDRIERFFPKGYSMRQMEDTIIKLLADWQRRRERANREHER
ncbi:ParB/RepB/Spo0J family partition protein [Eubacteriales bacterium OttesenSCG-928-K08]|nr:ParB/RepB/Spo0J family partition protein [Eubacteriales bacterium OttesenSCG-928-K08]